MHRPTLPFLVAAALLLVAPPALAASQAECEAAIEQVQRAMLSAPALENAPESRLERIRNILAEASAAGGEGDYVRCL